SHSSAILSRIEPEEVRYFRLDRKQRCTSVCPISMPDNKDEASQYVRLAIRAYPELYFAHFVILGEGDSERVLIPRIADAMDIQLDPSFVPIVPIGGRYVSHFWRLLNDLHIPHVTLLDLDLGRAHGGARLIADVVEKLKELGRDLSDNSLVKDGTVDFAKLDSLQDDDLLEKGGDHPWLKALQEEGVFFSFPLDIDFAMLHAFPKAYQHANPGGRGPRGDAKAILEKKATTLKTGGNPALYHDKYDDEFKWYPYLFLNRSKPETHIAALARIVSVEDAENAQIDSAKLGENAPAEIKALIQHVKEVLTI